MPLDGWAPSTKHVGVTTILMLILLPFFNWQQQMCSAQSAVPLSITLTADDLLMELYFDGTLVRTNQQDWSNVVSKTLPNNIKLIAVKCENQNDFAGFLASTSDGLLLTDSSWKCTSEPQTAGWANVAFNDSSWSAAEMVSPNQSPDEHGTVSGISPNAYWIWTARNGDASDTTVYCRSPVLPKSTVIDDFTCFPWTGSCYFLINQALNRINAASACSAKNARLAFVESADEQTVITRILKDANYKTGAIWVGGCRTSASNSVFVWTTTCTQTGPSSGAAVYSMSYTKWASTEPNNANAGGEWCINLAAYNNFLWYDSSCTGFTAYSICERGTSSVYISMTADSSVQEVYFEGSLIPTNHQGWSDVISYTLSSTNLSRIAVKCQNLTDVAGFLASTSDGLLVTDSSWKCTSQPQTAGWADPNFNDNSWPAAVIVSPNRSPDVHGIIAGINSNAYWIWAANSGSDGTVYCRSPSLPPWKISNGFTCFPWTGTCFKVGTQAANRASAASYCSSMNGHLAYIESAAKQQVIARVLANSNIKPGGSSKNVFIGGCRVDQTTFVWTQSCTQYGPSPGSAVYPMNYTNWNLAPVKEPNGYSSKPGAGEWCMDIITDFTNYQWNDNSCTNIDSNSICETTACDSYCLTTCNDYGPGTCDGLCQLGYEVNATSHTCTLFPYQIVGCYRDKSSGRDLPLLAMKSVNMTLSLCAKTCNDQGYPFAGTQYGIECYCGDTYGNYGILPDTSCNVICSGNSSQLCGGFYANTVLSHRLLTATTAVTTTIAVQITSSAWTDFTTDTTLLDVVDDHTDSGSPVNIDSATPATMTAMQFNAVATSSDENHDYTDTDSPVDIDSLITVTTTADENTKKGTTAGVNGDKVTAAAVVEQMITTAVISRRRTTVGNVATTTYNNHNNTTPHGPVSCVVGKCVKGGNCSSTNQTVVKYNCTSATGHCYVVYNLIKKRATYGCSSAGNGFNKTTYCPSQFAVRAKGSMCQFCCFGASMCNKQRYISDLDAMCAKVISSGGASTLNYCHILSTVLYLALFALSMTLH